MGAKTYKPCGWCRSRLHPEWRCLRKAAHDAMAKGGNG